MECQSRHLAFSRLRSDALRRLIFCLRFFAARRAAGTVAARPAQRSRRDNEHRDSDHVLGYRRAGVGRVEDEEISGLLVVHVGDDFMRCDFFDRQTGLRMAAEIRTLRRLH